MNKPFLSPLNYQVRIVDAQGRPTPEFQQKWRSLFRIAAGIPDVSNAAAMSLLLDLISDDEGDLLRRGTLAWSGLSTPGGTTKFLRADGTYAEPVQQSVDESDISLSDVLTNNVSSSRHGFAPKLSNDATQYLDGSGQWSTPAGGGGGGGGGGIDWLGAALAVKPAAASFTLATSTASPTGAALADDGGGIVLSCSSLGSGLAMAALQPILGTPFTATALLGCFGRRGGFDGHGLVACDTGTGRAVAIIMDKSRYDYVRLSGGTYGMDGYVSDSASAADTPFPNIPRWFKAHNDGTDLTFSISQDGYLFQQVFSFAVTDWLTTVTHIGPVLKSYSSQPTLHALHAYSWSLS